MTACPYLAQRRTRRTPSACRDKETPHGSTHRTTTAESEDPVKAKRVLTTAAMVTGGVALALWYSAPAGAEAATTEEVTLLGRELTA